MQLHVGEQHCSYGRFCNPADLLITVVDFIEDRWNKQQIDEKRVLINLEVRQQT